MGAPFGYFVSELGALNQVVHMWRYDSLADRERRRAALEADPAWARYRRLMWESGDVQRQENQILRAVPLPQLP